MNDKVKKTELTLGKLESLAAKLRSLPEVTNKDRKVSKQEGVRFLVEEIKAMQKRGYTLDQVREYLQGGGLDIGTTTLKNYLNRSKPTQKKAQKAKTDTPPAAPAPKGAASDSKTVEKKAGGTKATFEPREDSEEI